ncbi:MAG: 23S rRNA (adenine(2030)-N(6))-methyltransferase RlmJ [Gammaproteobacteria bacterium]|nr:23S rRNA (adenine(2030)-N(6))-methyltransferase RlmJ [Gammaproteobacteria bacterium]
MNYRHEFHAGNFADLMKHSLLVILLQALNRKSTGWCYYDSHAGTGRYDLHSEAARTTGEAEAGIGRLWRQRNGAPQAVQQLCAIVAACNPLLTEGQTPRYYPGSAGIAQALARSQDRLVLAELHPQEHRLLHKHLRNDARVAIHARDGYEMLTALVPPPERRGLALLDPPFEQTDEFERQLQALRDAYVRWSSGVYALWYPIKDEAAVKRFYRNTIKSGIQRVLVAEFRTAHAAVSQFSACGLLVVNPPWQCEPAMSETLHYLGAVLAARTAANRLQWLVAETRK